ncbi:MAG: thioesterase family protein [Lachnospiraceae bacterium]|nr:thioesterase family protein [Lachnospiraceae bacterium]
MLEAGIKGIRTVTVTESLTAKVMGSGELNVYATPAMIALMEETAYKSVAKELEDGMGSVGTKMDVQHVSASPVGMKISCETELIEVDGRRLVFAVKAQDEKGLIGEGTHERFIIENAKFQAKTDSKL